MELTKELSNNVAKWTKSLRSGKYEQGRDTLQRGNKFCCLGVLCDITIPSHKLNRNDDGSMYGACPYTNQPNAPEWVKYINKDFEDRTGADLAELNDSGYYGSGPLTFDEIADLLEAVYVLKVLEEK